MDGKTIFVIGAGASKEAGLPTGNEFKDKISELLDISYDDFTGIYIGDERLIARAIRTLIKHTDGNNIQSYIDEAWQIRDSLPLFSSINKCCYKFFCEFGKSLSFLPPKPPSHS